MQKSAISDATKKYRYVLGRQWGPDPKNAVNFVLLHPTTMDDKEDDAAIEKCVSLGQEWGFDAVLITNLFAFKAATFEEVRAAEEPVGKNNDAYLEHIAKSAKKVVVGWGEEGKFQGRDEVVLKILRSVADAVVTS